MARTISIKELLDGFYLEFKDKYPDIPQETMEKICRAEFQMMKDVIQSGSLEDIRLQYLFSLTVSPQKVMKQLRFTARYKENAGMSKEKNKKYLELILNHIRNNKDKFKKYEEKITKYTGLTRGQIDRGEYLNNGFKCNP